MDLMGYSGHPVLFYKGFLQEKLLKAGGNNSLEGSVASVAFLRGTKLREGKDFPQVITERCSNPTVNYC